MRLQFHEYLQFSPHTSLRGGGGGLNELSSLKTATVFTDMWKARKNKTKIISCRAAPYWSCHIRAVFKWVGHFSTTNRPQHRYFILFSSHKYELVCLKYTFLSAHGSSLVCKLSKLLAKTKTLLFIKIHNKPDESRFKILYGYYFQSQLL